jgi:hypothetical protein
MGWCPGKDFVRSTLCKRYQFSSDHENGDDSGSGFGHDSDTPENLGKRTGNGNVDTIAGLEIEPASKPISMFIDARLQPVPSHITPRIWLSPERIGQAG